LLNAAQRHDPAEELARLMRAEEGRDKVTAPLAIAITLALVTQFLNGYNTAVLNSVSQVRRLPRHNSQTPPLSFIERARLFSLSLSRVRSLSSIWCPLFLASFPHRSLAPR
jgi:hypothetical protein